MDRTEIYDLVRYERFCRDMLDWDGLQASFVSGSPVRTTWFDGTIEGFVEGSRAKMSSGVRQQFSPVRSWMAWSTTISSSAVFSRDCKKRMRAGDLPLSKVFTSGIGWMLSIQRIHHRSIGTWWRPSGHRIVSWHTTKFARAMM